MGVPTLGFMDAGRKTKKVRVRCNLCSAIVKCNKGSCCLKPKNVDIVENNVRSDSSNVLQ